MSTNSTGIEGRRLLPEPLENWLQGLVLRLAGAGLLVVGLLCWLSLLSWSAQDPSLTHAAGGSARNLVGATGAVTSDLLLQTLGLAALFALLAPALWGFDLLSKGHLQRARWKMAVLPIAVLMLAGGLSALPVPASWPLHHGLGGMLGDLVFRLVASLLGIVNPVRAGAAAGLVLLAGGMSAVASGLGITYQGLVLVIRHGPSIGPSTWPQALPGALAALRGAKWMPTGAFGRTASPAGIGGHPHEPILPINVGSAQEPVDEPSGGRDPEFDRVTLAKSKQMAVRFAPEGATASQVSGPRLPAAEEPSALVAMGGPSPRLEIPGASAPLPSEDDVSARALRGTRLLLQDALANLGVVAEVRAARIGPVVTEFEIELQRGTRAERVESLADDIARAMNAQSARVAIAPGGRLVVLELANVHREPVLLCDIVGEGAHANHGAVLPLVIGKSAAGEPVVVDLAHLQHVLIAGTEDSSRATVLKALVASLICNRAPSDCQILLIDPRRHQQATFAKLPHLLAAPVTDPAHGLAALGWIAREMDERSKRIASVGIRSIAAFNDIVRDALKRAIPLVRTVQTGVDPRTGLAVREEERLECKLLPRIVVVIDELADLMAADAPTVEEHIAALGEHGSAVGIHLVVGTGRPTADVLTRPVRHALPARISLRTASRSDSCAILGAPGAEQLLGQGDMLLATHGAPVLRVHGATSPDEEIEALLASRASVPASDRKSVPARAASHPRDDDAMQASLEPIYDMAVAIAMREHAVSVAGLERRLGARRDEIAAVVARLESRGIVGPADRDGWHALLGGGHRIATARRA